MLSRDFVRYILDYNPDTGVFRWRASGKLAGHLDKSNGYLRIGLLRGYYYAHTLAWYYMTGEWTEVDHRNRVQHDNRFENLLPCTRSQNLRNTTRKPGQTPGVTFSKQHQKWQVHVYLKHKSIYVGIFESKEQALAVRQAAEQKYYT